MKSILVTGGNNGIGFALCRQLVADYDCKVYLGARSAERGQKAVEEIKTKHPTANIELLVMDVSDDASVKAAAEQMKKKNVTLYALVNNAGVGFKTGSGCNDELLATNFYGPKRVTDAFVDIIDGRVVNVSSGAASMFLREQSSSVKKFFTNPETTWEELVTEVENKKTSSQGMGVYGLSKAGLNLITIQQGIAYPHLKCTSLSPGFIATNMTKGWNAKLTPEQGTVSLLKCLFAEDVTSGYYYGSDGLRSPLTMTRDPGTPEYEGEDEESIDRAKYNN